MSVRVSRAYRAPAWRVFEAWLDPTIAGRWLFATAAHPMTHVDIDARVAGTFRFVERRGETLVEHNGKYVALVPTRRLVFTLTSSDRAEASTLVTVDIRQQRAGCSLALLHERVPAGRARELKTRWIGILYGLRVTLDAMRPFPIPPASEGRRAVTGEAQCITC
jgi:uncharacterized protein YndB with AHSA1/START domain